MSGENNQVEEQPRFPLMSLLRGMTEAVFLDGYGTLRTAAPPPRVVVAGSFNPVHAGHWGLAEAGRRRAGEPVAFELSVMNADKPPLTVEELWGRLRQFAGQAPVWVTRAPTFVEKARLFPGALFVVGADTAARVIVPRYYPDNETGLRRAMASIRAHGCRFLVAGRVDRTGAHVGLEDLAVPTEFADLFTSIPASEFRLDLSSTALRSQSEGANRV
jgi:hypothetical protein